jgi:hypothetical protein
MGDSSKMEELKGASEVSLSTTEVTELGRGLHPATA